PSGRGASRSLAEGGRKNGHHQQGGGKTDPASLMISANARGSSRPLSAERLEEEEDQGNEKDVDDQRLDQDEAQDQRAANVAHGAGIAGDRFGRRADSPPLRERAKAGGEGEREARGDDRPLGDLRRAGSSLGPLRVKRRGRAGNQHQSECQNGTS